MPRGLDDLLAHTCVDYAFHNYPAPSTWTFTEADCEERQAKPATRLTVNNGHALVEAALAGGGIIRASELAIASHLETGRLVPILTDFASGAPPHMRADQWGEDAPPVTGGAKYNILAYSRKSVLLVTSSHASVSARIASSLLRSWSSASPPISR